MTRELLKEGDRVGVCSRHGTTAFRNVVRVTKRFAELSDGSKWQPDGYDTFPRHHDRWSTVSVRVVTPAEEDAIKMDWGLKIRRNELARIHWRDVPDDVVRAVYDIANNAGLVKA